jgi:hypothetical protein
MERKREYEIMLIKQQMREKDIQKATDFKSMTSKLV